MKAHIENDWMRDALKVWIYQPAERGATQIIGFDENGEALLQVIEPGVQPGPSMVLPRAALEALVATASGVLPPSEVTVDAMRDARETRDRLLTLVERLTPAPQDNNGRQEANDG